MLTTATAAWVLGLHLATYHSAPTYRDHRTDVPFNNVNPGLYVVAPNGLTAGFYRNSYRRDSVYVGWSYRAPTKVGEFGLTVGAVTGYETKQFGKVMPLLVPSYKAGPFRLSFIPKVEKNGASAVHLSTEWSF